MGLVAEEFEGGEEERTWEGSEGRDIGADRNAEWLGVEARKKGFFFRGRRLAGEGEGDEILCSNFVGRSSPESLPHGGRRGRAGTGTVTLPVATCPWLRGQPSHRQAPKSHQSCSFFLSFL